ncbi:MAG: signal recognition particle-docking protein FtsY [Ruminococcus sp.]|jgi:fused signal recognition particle receptor|nr:signal recognition particle-docking protein FtsY [Ruminococcus sp.]
MNIFEKLGESLKKTRENIAGKLSGIKGKKIDDSFYDELEEILITSDLGFETSTAIVSKLKKAKLSSTDTLMSELKAIITDMLSSGGEADIDFDGSPAAGSPAIILVIGVNGAGKTTTIGKLAAKLKAEGKKVIIAAADTFRAAAIDQIAVWAERSECELIRRPEGSDPASVVYDALDTAKARKADVLIIDTAGRLHNKKHLMDELSKIRRIIADKTGTDTETLLVLDATTGQNAVNQAKLFNEACGVTGIVLTKLDGTAKGGIVIPIVADLKIPVKLIGTGEKIEDLDIFDPEAFAKGLFDDSSNE